MKKILALAVILGGCAQPPQFDWRMPDGSAPDPQKLQTAETICRGRASAALLSGSVSTLSPPRDREFMAANVLNGCLAEQGLVPRPLTAPR